MVISGSITSAHHRLWSCEKRVDYNVIKNFNYVKIVRRIAIYNIYPDIVSE
jgi:hypothetical protein